jgi:hypothetical protein
LPAAEVGLAHGLPDAGAVTSQIKVLDQRESVRSLQLRLAAPSNSQQSLLLRLNDPKIRVQVEGAKPSANNSRLDVQFPAGNGYVEKVVTLSW